MADLEGGLQVVLSQAVGLSAHCCITHQDVQGPMGGRKQKNKTCLIDCEMKTTTTKKKDFLTYQGEEAVMRDRGKISFFFFF